MQLCIVFTVYLEVDFCKGGHTPAISKPKVFSAGLLGSISHILYL